MTRKKKPVYYFVVLIVAMSFTVNAFASMLPTINIAILDNFTAEKSSQKYKDAYFAGMAVAESAAKLKGFSINYKTFTYGSEPLAILNSIAEVKAWNPDFIIGPHSSNQFLLMPKHFKDVLVISPYATDEAIAKMPANFYSLSLPDSYMAKATIAFLAKYYPGKDIFNLTQADCKDCYDVTTIFNEQYKQKYPNANIQNSFYTGNNVEELNLSKVMAGYKPGSIIILQPLSYADANVLIIKISKYLKQKDTVFIHNLDNWGNSSEARIMESDNTLRYFAFRVCPLIENLDSRLHKNFVTLYKNKFHSFPHNAVSYMSYISVMSAVDALTTFPPDAPKTMRSAIISSYHAAQKKNPYWYRPDAFIFYQVDSDSEKIREIIYKR